jgi:lysyl-tRNA synthetase class II
MFERAVRRSMGIGKTMVELIDGVFGAYCEPHLQDACFVINQPVEMSRLASREVCRISPREDQYSGISVVLVNHAIVSQT